MPVFRLACQVTVSAYTEIEADTLEEAIEESKQRSVVLGGLGSGAEPSESWLIEDADGSPSGIVEDV